MRNWLNSLSLFLPQPSLIFVGIEEEALLNWLVIPNNSSFGKIEVILALGPSKDKTNEIAKKLEATSSSQKNKIKTTLIYSCLTASLQTSVLHLQSALHIQ